MKQLIEAGGLYYEIGDGEKAVARQLNKEPGTIFIAELEGKVVGTVAIQENGRFGFIWRLAVDKSVQMQGIGSKLLDIAETELKKRGIQLVSIFFDHKNTKLRQFYKKRGYFEGGIYQWAGKELE